VRIQKFSIGAESKNLSDFLQLNSHLKVVDNRFLHLSELYKIRNLGKEGTWEHLSTEFLERHPDYGTAIYYPWRKELYYIAEEKEFVEVRTARNRNKITTEEQRILDSKTIGIVGLSVGFSVFMAAVLERVASTIKIADFDELSLSNLNRLPFSSLEIGKRKTQLAYQWAMEIDPYIEVFIYDEGINLDNIDDFFVGEKPLDLVIDECDDGKIKLELRIKARHYKLPLLMETSDRGLLDVENYQNGYSLFHGRIEDEELSKLRESSSREIIMKFVDISTASKRGRDSMMLIGKTLDTWPQLGSDVLHGGASVIIAARNILLGNPVESGRYFVDLQKKLGVDEF
jgi:hypothetical protein